MTSYFLQNSLKLFQSAKCCRDSQMSYRIVRMILLLAIPLIVLTSGKGQIPNIEIDPGTHHVSTTDLDRSVTLTIPNNPLIESIKFNLTGGDGGKGSADLFGGFFTNGGEGASVEMEVRVGNGTGEVPPGSILRLVEGEKGLSKYDGLTYEYGGGGGGSAVLFRPPGGGWVILAVAGGGGGASGVRHGQGGRATMNGGQIGDDTGDGGIGGNGGKSGKGAGGGGAFTAGEDVLCEGFPSLQNYSGGGQPGGTDYGLGGSGGGCVLDFYFANGGDGFGAGGAGANGGGGGGGYSGGGGGLEGTLVQTGNPAYFAGGGGGSYINSEYSIHPEDKPSNGSNTSSPENGVVYYSVSLKSLAVAHCKDATIYLDNEGKATLKVSDIDDGSTDEDGTLTSWVLSKTDFDCSHVGKSQLVELYITNKDGIKDTCTAIVTVKDTISPVASCMEQITVQLDENGTATLIASAINNNSTDNCGIDFIEVSPASVSCSDIGNPVEVTLTVTDESGNTSSCTTLVTVVDEMAPVVEDGNVTIPLDETGMATLDVSDFSDVVSDNCGIASLEANPASFSCADTGTAVEVMLTVTDNSGNVSTGTIMVTVVDDAAPSVECKDINISLNENGLATIVPADINNLSTDNCGIASMEVDPSSFSCSDAGTTVEVTLTATDYSGNVSTCVSQVTVEDNVDPIAVCDTITLPLDPSGIATISPEDLDGGSTDACGISSLEASQTVFTMEDLGDNFVTLTVMDMNGNTADCKALIQLKELIPPVVRTNELTVFLNKYGRASISPGEIDNGSTDNHQIAEMWLEGLTEYGCEDIGVHEVVLKVKDQSGNIGSRRTLVTVKTEVPDLKSTRGVSDGDTIQMVTCQSPWPVFSNELVNYDEIKKYGRIRASIHREELPEDAPWGMYKLWRYEYIFEGPCGQTQSLTLYAAQYDLGPPVYQSFPGDITIASAGDLPPVDEEVEIIDLCQYVEWDTVITFPVLDPETGDTLAFTRRWMARDPSGHQSYRDQMIWVGAGNREQYGMISGRIADDTDAQQASFTGEAGTNGLLVSLYRLDELTGLRTLVDSAITGDWMTANGTYYFQPLHPGKYQLKIDSALCVVDTSMFDNQGWSDTLMLGAGLHSDQGLISTQDCMESMDTVEVEGVNNLSESNYRNNTQSYIDQSWRIYPNPAEGYLYIRITTREELRYEIYDMLGRSVKHGIYHQGEAIDILGLSSGVYHLRLSMNEAVLGTKKVLLAGS